MLPDTCRASLILVCGLVQLISPSDGTSYWRIKQKKKKKAAFHEILGTKSLEKSAHQSTTNSPRMYVFF